MATLESLVEHCTDCGTELEISQIGACSDCSPTKSTIRVVVLCLNSEGEAEFHTCSADATSAEVASGYHLELAKENATYNGFEPLAAFDEKSPAAKQISHGLLSTWL